MNQLSGKKLLFIGGGAEQVGTICWATEHGIIAYVADIHADAPGFLFAQETLTYNIRDKETILDFARKNKVDGITSICLESTMTTIAYVVDEMGLPGLGTEVTKNVTNKFRMRTLFEKQGLPVPQYQLIFYQDIDHLEFPDFEGPWVIKPVDNAGSRGIKFIENRCQIKNAYKNALNFSRSKQVLIEKFIPGKEISVEGYVIQGKLLVATLSDKNRSAMPYLFDLDLTFPSRYPQKVQNEAIRQMQEAVKALGIKNGPVHGELMVSHSEKVMIVEIAGRGPGSKVYTEIIPFVSGIYPNRLQIYSALNCEPPEIFQNKILKGATLYFFTTNRRAIIKRFENLEKVNRLPGVFECRFYVKLGDTVEECKNGEQRFGHLITMADTLEQAIMIQKKALSLIKIDFEYGHDLMASRI